MLSKIKPIAITALIAIVALWVYNQYIAPALGGSSPADKFQA